MTLILNTYPKPIAHLSVVQPSLEYPPKVVGLFWPPTPLAAAEDKHCVDTNDALTSPRQTTTECGGATDVIAAKAKEELELVLPPDQGIHGAEANMKESDVQRVWSLKYSQTSAVMVETRTITQQIQEPLKLKAPKVVGISEIAKKAGSKIMSKVGKRKNLDDTEILVDNGDEHKEDEAASDDSPLPTFPAPRELESLFLSEFSRLGSDNKAAKEESVPAPDVSGLSPKDESQPSVSEKASEASEGAKDGVYNGAGAAAGALGINDAASKEPQSEEGPVVDVVAKTEEVGNREYDAATDAMEAVSNTGSEVAQQTKDTLSSKDPSSTVESKAYEAKDAAARKARDLNNAD